MSMPSAACINFVGLPLKIHILLYMGETSRTGKTKQSGFLPTMDYDILTISDLLAWLRMAIYVNKPEVTDNMQLKRKFTKYFL